ncbi:uncharacterized protein Z518_08633 [Rhinocladiella mackenziei CBS 650.93]|uniref:2-hydroxyacyl-CoA lyase n=1 Tax=Rhinocladiella mackenziei CBS 650.93 TaxID=1442369 RepID=A0A0D2IHB0_9EURO|nr:uncharacterized protein Z518_08633 [Rhinocladiella mackenziei CBS 650.93]KIX02691.1 hypothetical protein Z518_08633 [Rhinocladiella mackenziei CBS 650.93]
MDSLTGAKVIAQALHDLGVSVIHTLVGIPIADIAEEAIDLGVRVIGYRNEQACSYAASAYGYLTGRPGVCILTGGPGILHGMAGMGNASTNSFPLLVLGGSAESTLVTKGGFQELDAITLLTPHTKTAIRPASRDPSVIAAAIRNAYRTCWYGRPGPAFVDLPTDLIMAPSPIKRSTSHPAISVLSPPKPMADPILIASAADLVKSSSSPLVIVGKGSAYARAEGPIRSLISTHHLPFLPTPMGKGIVPDSHPLNASSARSTALKHADVILLLGARLNWILHFGESPKYRPDVKIIQVDISPEELGRTNSLGQPALSIFGDIGLVVNHLRHELGEWKAFPTPSIRSPPSQSAPSSYLTLLADSAAKNEQKSQRLAQTSTPRPRALTYERAYHIIRMVLHALSPPEDGGIVYISEGANTMDISRGAFPLEHPRQRLDAGTWGTMGVGLGYAIAAWAAYNLPGASIDKADPSGSVLEYDTNLQKPVSKKKKIIALEGDSALGFSGMEIETMARHKMDVMVVVMNNSGIYKGDALDEPSWNALQHQTVANDTAIRTTANSGSGGSRPMNQPRKGLRSTSLLYETRYEALAAMVGGGGYFVRTEEELAQALKEAFLETAKVCVLNVIIDPGLNSHASFGWFEQKEKHGNGADGGKEKTSKL